MEKIWIFTNKMRWHRGVSMLRLRFGQSTFHSFGAVNDVVELSRYCLSYVYMFIFICLEWQSYENCTNHTLKSPRSAPRLIRLNPTIYPVNLITFSIFSNLWPHFKYNHAYRDVKWLKWIVWNNKKKLSAQFRRIFARKIATHCIKWV